MAQIVRKWLQDHCVNNQKIDNNDVYQMGGLKVDPLGMAGSIAVGVTNAQDAIHVRRSGLPAGIRLDSSQSYRIISDPLGSLDILAGSVRRVQITPKTTFIYDASVIGELEIQGDRISHGDDYVHGYSLVDFNSRVGGNFTVDGDSAIHGDSVINGNEIIYGSTLFSGNSRVGGNFTVDGDLAIHGGTQISGDTTISGNFQVLGDSSVNGTLTASDVVFDYSLVSVNSRVGGNFTVDGILAALGDTQISGDTTISGGLHVLGDSSVNGTLTASDAVFDYSLVSANSQVGGNFTVDGDSVTYGTSMISGDSTVNGDLYVLGDLTTPAFTTVNTRAIKIQNDQLTVQQNGTMSWVKHGRHVTVTLPYMAGTSNSNTLTIFMGDGGYLPPEIDSSVVNALEFSCIVLDNGTYVPGKMEILANGFSFQCLPVSINGAKSVFADNFTTSGTKGVPDMSFTYITNN